MEHRTWSWRRKPCEKVIVANRRASLSLERNVGEEDRYTETGSSRCPSNLSERLSSVLCDCTFTEELVKNHNKLAEQALAGQQKAEADITFLKQGLDNNLSNAAADFEKMRKKFENKIVESNKRVSNYAEENSNLVKALLCKEKLVEDLDKGKVQLEGEVDRLLAKLDSTLKENTYLKYNCNVLEEELKVRNEERKYNHRLSLDNAKQINSLEVECRQLRDLVRKRLQDPTIGLNMKKPSKGTSFLIERVYDLEKENKTLREMLSLMDNELQSWRIKYAEMASRVGEVEAQLRELSQGEQSMQLAVSSFEAEKIDDSRTWVSALLTELEQFRKGNIENEPECLALEMGPMNGLVVQTANKELVSPCDISSKTTGESSKCYSWLDEVLRVILEEHRTSKRSFGDLLRDIRIVVGCKDDLSNHEEGNMPNISGLLPWKSSNLACIGDHNRDISLKEASHSIDAPPNRRNTLAQMIQIQLKLQEDEQGPEERLQVVNEANQELKKQLQESNRKIEGLKNQVEILKETKGDIEEQIENQRLINEELDTQLTVARAKLNEILHKLSCLEVELEDKNNSCEELETTCLELQLQLETISRHNSPNFNRDPQAEESRTTETIQTLGNKMNVRTSPNNMLHNTVLGPITTMEMKAQVSDEKSPARSRSSLLDRMLADSDDQTRVPKSPSRAEKLSNVDLQTPPSTATELMKSELPAQQNIKTLTATEWKTMSPALVVVPSKKSYRGFGFVRKMFLRRKRGCSKMKPIPLQRNTSALIGPRNVVVLV